MNEFRFKNIDSKKMFSIVFSIICINILFSRLFLKIISLSDKPLNSSQNQFESKTEEFVYVVLRAPVIETLLFQFLPAYLLKKYNPVLTVIVSATLFGLFHWYNWLHALYGFAVGILFIVAYFYSDKRYINPVITILIAHLIYNLISFIWNNWF